MIESADSFSKVHVILCTDIQPFPLAETSLCCSVAVQENSSVLLNAICATAAAHEAASRIGGKNPLATLISSPNLISSQREALRYKAVTLQLLSQILGNKSSRITDATVLCVAVLLIVDAIFGDVVALTAHICGLEHMLEQHELSKAVSTHIKLAILKASIIQRTQPLHQLSCYEQCRFDALSCQIADPQDAVVLGSGIWSSRASRQISPAIQDCARCMAHLILFIERAKASRRKVNTLSIDDFIALEHILISMPYRRSLSGMDECIRLALLLYSNIAIWKIPLSFAWVGSLVACLKIALLSLRSDEVTKDRSGLLFWILLMGRYAASVGHSEGEIMWWSNRLKLMVSVLQITKWEGAQEILKQFFFVDEVCGESWKTVWGMLVGREEEDDEKILQEFKHPCSYHS